MYLCQFPFLQRIQKLTQTKVTDTAKLKEHLKLDKAGIPSLTSALLEVRLSEVLISKRRCADEERQRFDINITDEDTDRFLTSTLLFDSFVAVQL
jgi:hypothetical protein